MAGWVEDSSWYIAVLVEVRISTNSTCHSQCCCIVVSLPTAGSIVAPISRISKFGAFMDLEGGIQGLIHLSEISHGVVKDIRDYIKV